MITNALNSLFSGLINGVFNAITTLLDILLTPVNALIDGLFPSLTIYVANFTGLINQYVAPTISYFFNLLPPLTKSTIILWVTFLIAYYGVSWSYSLFVKTFNVIQKIKLW